MITILTTSALSSFLSDPREIQYRTNVNDVPVKNFRAPESFVHTERRENVFLKFMAIAERTKGVYGNIHRGE